MSDTPQTDQYKDLDSIKISVYYPLNRGKTTSSIYGCTLTDATKEALIQYIEALVKKAEHDQRHKDIGVSKWIKVGEEWEHWSHPMTEKKMRKQLSTYMEKQKDKTYQQGYDDCLKEHEIILTKRR